MCQRQQRMCSGKKKNQDQCFMILFELSIFDLTGKYRPTHSSDKSQCFLLTASPSAQSKIDHPCSMKLRRAKIGHFSLSGPMMHNLSLTETIGRLSKLRSTSMMTSQLGSSHQQNNTTLEPLQDLCGVLAAFTYRLLADRFPGGQHHPSDEKLQHSPTLMLSASVILHSWTGCCDKSHVYTPSHWKA